MSRIRNVLRCVIVWIRWPWRIVYLACILYTLSHLADVLYYWSGTSFTTRMAHGESALKQILDLPPNRLRLAAVISDILHEDGIVEAKIWSLAIARHVPTDEPGYVALVMAQIRRESRFNAPDLEWLYDHLVPDLLHDKDIVKNRVNTVGPMQINRNQLLALMHKRNENKTVTIAEGPAFTKLVSDIDLGVKYAVIYLDEIVLDYIPNRKLYGWYDYIGHQGMFLKNEVNQPPTSDRELFHLYETVAAYQKMLSDLSHKPLALDGMLGNRTLQSARSFAMRLPSEDRKRMLEALSDEYSGIEDVETMLKDDSFRLVCKYWQQVYGRTPSFAIYPRISHDPRLIFILADFNIGKSSCRIAVMQQMLNVLYKKELQVDGKYKSMTLASIRDYILKSSIAEDRRNDFLSLIDQKRKLGWVRSEVTAMLSYEWQELTGEKAPNALCPQLYTKYINQQKKAIERISTREYVSGSVWFFENYYVRLHQKLALHHSHARD